MANEPRLFAEDLYQAAFDRGACAAERAFEDAFARRKNIAPEWHLSRSHAATLVQDLLTGDHAERARQLAISVAHAGLRVRWRKLAAHMQRKSGVMLRVMLPSSARTRAS